MMICKCDRCGMQFYNNKPFRVIQYTIPEDFEVGRPVPKHIILHLCVICNEKFLDLMEELGRYNGEDLRLMKENEDE